MKWYLSPRIRRRIEAAEAAAERNEERLEQTKQRQDEVRELASWSRRAVEKNHLTGLFLDGLHGKEGLT